jgi:AcrR family transcriptional regulator
MVEMGRKSLAEERRSQLVDAYYRCLAKRGIEGCSMSSIAKEAGMVPSIINHYFGTKEELMKELINRVVTMYEQLVFSQLEEIAEPEERLDSLLAILFSDELLTGDFAKAYTAVLHRASQDKEVREAFSDAMQRCYAMLMDDMQAVALPKGISSEEVNRTAVMIIALADGILIHTGISPHIVRPSMALNTARDLLESCLKGGM